MSQLGSPTSDLQNRISPLKFSDDDDDFKAPNRSSLKFDSSKSIIDQTRISRADGFLDNNIEESSDQFFSGRKYGLALKTPEKRPDSPVLFDLSPKLEGPKAFPKKLQLLPPSSSAVSSAVPKTERDSSMLPEDVGSRTDSVMKQSPSNIKLASRDSSPCKPTVSDGIECEKEPSSGKNPW